MEVSSGLPVRFEVAIGQQEFNVSTDPYDTDFSFNTTEYLLVSFLWTGRETVTETKVLKRYFSFQEDPNANSIVILAVPLLEMDKSLITVMNFQSLLVNPTFNVTMTPDRILSGQTVSVDVNALPGLLPRDYDRIRRFYTVKSGA